MDFEQWIESLPDEQCKELAALDESEVMEYLGDHDIALPDEMLEDVAGGINPFALLGQAIKRKLTGKS